MVVFPLLSSFALVSVHSTVTLSCLAKSKAIGHVPLWSKFLIIF